MGSTAGFPGPVDSLNARVLRADGVPASKLVDAVLQMINLDEHSDSPVVMMQPEPGDRIDPDIEAEYREAVIRHWPGTPPVARMERFAFYARASKAFAVVVTGETRPYGNVILKKGVVPVAPVAAGG